MLQAFNFNGWWIMTEKDNEKSNNNGKRRVLIIISVLLIICGLSIFVFQAYNRIAAKNEDEKISSVATTVASSGTQKTAFSQTENGYFDKMQQELDAVRENNGEAYSWIYVPDTNVNYPICQSAVDDEFYLRHSSVDQSWIASGAIYTESCNTKTFDDRVTVIYGHNGYSDSMFTSLHKFEDSDFFSSSEHEYFYIYTSAGKKLKYQVISAFKYDDRHIMNSFDFQNNQVFESFIEMIKNPSSANKNVRKELDKEITVNDNIAVLSTCITNQKSNRYLVCGVLVENEETN